MSVISIEQLLAQTKAPLIPIVIDAVEGAESHTDDFSMVTVMAGNVVTVSGALAIPDRVFNMPVKWKGDWRLFQAVVVGGRFSVQVWFTESGVAVYDDECANKDLMEPVFSTSRVQFDVLAKPLTA